MTQEIIEIARQAFIKRGFWPNEVMWKCWLDAWILSAQHEREACAKTIDDLFHVWCKESAEHDETPTPYEYSVAIRARGGEA